MNLREIYRQDSLPVFQNRMYDSSEAARACPKGDIRLVEDMETGLVFNAAFDPALVDYDEHYQNEQGLSSAFHSHLENVAELIETTMGRENLVEVGCGKGAFLEFLLTRGNDIQGFDPAYEGANPRIQRRYFSEDMGLSGTGLILRHVLEHIPDPVGFLERLAAANGRKGLIYIEVPCFDWICRNKSWFDIFYEHVNYFRLSDFARIFERALSLGRSFNGQYLSIVADLASLRRPVHDPADGVAFPADFLDHLRADAGQGAGSQVIWGGASKGVVYALMKERAGHPVARVIDINPAKQGRYLAATGLRVLSPDEGLANLPEGTLISVMNPNYLDEIRLLAGPRFRCKDVKP